MSILKYDQLAAAAGSGGGGAAIDISYVSGEESAFIFGGYGTFNGTPYFRCEIDRFPFTSDTSSTCIGSTGNQQGYGHVATSACDHTIILGNPNAVMCFPHASQTNATYIGTYPGLVRYGQGGGDNTNGYITAQDRSPPAIYSCVKRFPFANAATGHSNVATQSPSRAGFAMNDGTNLYFAGDIPTSTTITCFSMSSETMCNAYGNLSVYRNRVQVGQDGSSAKGYIQGGQAAGVDEFNFSSGGTATCIGDMGPAPGSPVGICRCRGVGHSSVTSFYSSFGQRGTPTNYSEDITKFNFASGTAFCCIGNAGGRARQLLSGGQV